MKIKLTLIIIVFFLASFTPSCWDPLKHTCFSHINVHWIGSQFIMNGLAHTSATQRSDLHPYWQRTSPKHALMSCLVLHCYVVHLWRQGALGCFSEWCHHSKWMTSTMDHSSEGDTCKSTKIKWTKVSPLVILKYSLYTPSSPSSLSFVFSFF